MKNPSNKKIVVIKLGGSALQNSGILQELATLVRGYQERKYKVVLVHGGGPAINLELTRRGIEWKFIDGQRQTTPQMIGVIDEVLAGHVNGMVVENLRAAGITAIGMSGAGDRILHCRQANAELMQVGQIEDVDTEVIEHQLKFNAVPVIAPIGIGADDERYNINADWAATQIAIALKAKQLVFLTDQNGILDQNKELVKRATPLLVDLMIETGAISGGMCTKVRAMTTALLSGVKQVRVLHASAAGRALSENVGTVLAETRTNKELAHVRAS